MKKSIAILSVVVLLVFQKSCREYAREFSKEFSVTNNSVAEQIPVVSAAIFKADGGETPPWKDPWQWIQLFRNLWQF